MKKAKLFMMLALLVMGVSNLFAQNVTVHPGNGSMMAAKKSTGGDTFFNWGGYATWKHEQLSLTLSAGDSDNNSGTDENGQLANPANDIFASADSKCLQIGKGNSMDTYLTFSLPKGYRFTGYTITFHRISQPNGASGSVNNYNGNISFGETNTSFTYMSTSNTSGIYRGSISINNSTQYTLSRTSNTDTDMGNVLYFRLSNNSSNGRCFIQLDHVELLFTAEANYAPLIPAPNTTDKSAVDIPFTTSKMDYGTLTYQSDGGSARISYNGTVHDLNANLTLFEEGSVKEVSDNGFDGTAGYMVDYKSGSISSAGDYFKLESSKHGNLSGDTAIYYIESPIWATNTASTSAHKNPIGYRIVSASFEYASGETYVPATFYIRYESTGHGEDQDGIYGLNLYNGAISYNYNYQSVWRIDEDGYIYNGEYYLQAGQGNNSTTLSVTTTKPNASRGTFEIVENNGQMQICRKSNTNYYIGWEERTGQYGNITRSVVLTTSEDNRAYYDEQSAAGMTGDLNYTFLIYDKTGTKVEKKEVVNGTNGTLSIDGLNNDAVKIGVIGTALIKGKLTMQALDPYIDHIDIVCQEQGGNGGKLTQQFNATDFSVRGGKFSFYVPEDFKAPAKFTFENLYSKYGDNTYYEANNNPEQHARYSFVWSPYWEGTTNIYDTDPNHVYTDKIHTEKPGKVKFTFNNAETVGSSGGEFEEYPFNPGLYGESNFDDFIFTQDEMNGGTTKTAYLFTCDETRYNIAPTTATQHTYYAYYEMTIDMQKKTYQPILTWEKLYDETFYSANNTDIKRDSKWGLKLTTENVTDDQGTHSGYLTVTQILENIKGREASGTEGSDDYKPAIASALTGGDDAPSTMDQILYIDGSDLMSIVENQTASGTGDNVTYTTHTTSELKNELDKNALVYLPYGSQSSNDNFAYNTIATYGETPIFRGASNIVINDRYPFFAPYDIQVDAAKMAKYERTITNPNYDPILHATIVLPFEINVDADGLHTNNDGEGTPFTLSTMNSSNALAKAEGSKTDFYGEGYFTTITEKSVPNTPYIVTLENAGEDGFIAHVNGSLVKATPKDANGVFENETSTGTFEGTTYNFTHTGTYTGKEIANASTATETVFYFANNYFLDSKTLSTGKSLKILPFRSFYAYTTSGGSAGAKMTRFSIVFGENENDNNTTGISKVQRDADLAVIPGDGRITLMAKTDKDVTIHAVNGQTIDKCNLKAGDSRTVSLPAGVYVINGVKMIVK